MKIWAKVMVDQKIKKDTLFEEAGDFDPAKFRNYLEEIAFKLNIGTPIILSKHINHFLEFNITNFGPNDFAESVEFELLTIENIIT